MEVGSRFKRLHSRQAQPIENNQIEIVAAAIADLPLEVTFTINSSQPEVNTRTYHLWAELASLKSSAWYLPRRLRQHPRLPHAPVILPTLTP